MLGCRECPSRGDRSGVKPERQVMSGAKSSVSGMGIEAHVVFAGFWSMDFKRWMSNSFVGVAVFWVVVSLYLRRRLRRVGGRLGGQGQARYHPD